MDQEYGLVAMLNKLETWSPAETNGELAQGRIDWLDDTLQKLDRSSLLYPRLFRRFRALCRQSRLLPSACFLLNDITLHDRHPLHQTAFSDIYKGQYGKISVALKSLRVHGNDRARVEKAFYDETATWRCLRHPNIVSFLGTSNVLPVCLISEWMENGDIASFLRNRPKENRMPYVLQILDGLSYIHSLGVVHADLKTANILVNADQKACLSDFGLTMLLHNTGTITATSPARGTLRWLAPELLIADGIELDSGKPSQASDMYAFGMVLWELFTGRVPFDHIPSEYKILMDVLNNHRPPRPEDAGEIGFCITLWEIMQRCWIPEPDRRPSCPEVLEALIFAEGPSEPMVESHEIADGVYEIINVKTQQVLDLPIMRGRPVSQVVMWEPHGGDNQRWIISKESQGHLISSVDGGGIFSIAPGPVNHELLVVISSPSFWKFIPVEGSANSFRIIDSSKNNAIVVLAPTPGTLYGRVVVLPIGRVDSEWRLVREPDPPVKLDGVFAVINVETGKALGTSFMGQSRVVADGLIKHKWVFKSTRRGHIIRLSGAEPNSFVCMEGRRPPREGARLLTLSYSQTWRLEAVEGDAESTIFRIYWPDKSLAIGVADQLLAREDWLGQTTASGRELVALYPPSDSEKAPGLHWRLEPVA